MHSEYNPTIRIFEDGTALSRFAAASFVSAAHSAIMERGVFSVALSGGGTPQQFYELLASPIYSNQIDWARVHLFWGDERAVPPDTDGSNFKQFKEAITCVIDDSFRFPKRVPEDRECFT